MQLSGNRLLVLPLGTQQLNLYFKSYAGAGRTRSVSSLRESVRAVIVVLLLITSQSVDLRNLLSSNTITTHGFDVRCQ